MIRVGNVDCGKFGSSPFSGIKNPVVKDGGLRFIRPDYGAVFRMSRVGAVDDLNAEDAFGNENHVADHGKPGRQFNGIEPGYPFRRRRIFQAQDPQSEIPRGQIEVSV